MCLRRFYEFSLQCWWLYLFHNYSVSEKGNRAKQTNKMLIRAVYTDSPFLLQEPQDWSTYSYLVSVSQACIRFEVMVTYVSLFIYLSFFLPIISIIFKNCVFIKTTTVNNYLCKCLCEFHPCTNSFSFHQINVYFLSYRRKHWQLE